MDRLETAQTLGMLGGALAALNWIPRVILLARFRHLIIVSGLWLVVLPALAGFCICALSFRAVTVAQSTPERAKQQFFVGGCLGILVGALCVANVFLIVSGVLVLVAGSEADNVAQRIAQARRQTGFPLRTVATAAGSPWHRRLSCAYCGAPLVVTLVVPERPDVRVEASCPLDGIRDRQRLPLSQLEEWAPVMADRLHRCTQCGQRTAALLIIHHGVLFATVHPVCTNQHRNSFRRIWTPLYSHVERTLAADVSSRPAGVPSRVYPSVRPYGGQGFQPLQPFSAPSAVASTTAPAQPGAIPRQPVVPPRAVYLTHFCRVCGARVEPGDRFCYQCGVVIR